MHLLGTVKFSFENNQTISPVTLKGFYMYGISLFLFALIPLFCDTNWCLHPIHSVSFNATLSHHKRANIKALIQLFFETQHNFGAGPRAGNKGRDLRGPNTSLCGAQFHPRYAGDGVNAEIVDSIVHFV